MKTTNHATRIEALETQASTLFESLQEATKITAWMRSECENMISLLNERAAELRYELANYTVQSEQVQK